MEMKMERGDNGHGKGTFSFIEILYVVIRKRKLLAFGTVGVTLALAIGYFILPPLQYQSAKDKRQNDAVISIAVSTQMGDIGPMGDMAINVRRFLNEPVNLLKAYKEAGFEEFESIKVDDESKKEYLLLAMRRRLIQNANIAGIRLRDSDKIYNLEEAEGNFEISLKGDDVEKSKAFLRILTNDATIALVRRLEPAARSFVSSYERLLAIPGPSEAKTNAIVNLSEEYTIAKSVLDGSASPIIVNQEPYVLAFNPLLENYYSQYVKRAVTMEALILALLLVFAFLMHYVESLRVDPDVMSRLREAMGRKAK